MQSSTNSLKSLRGKLKYFYSFIKNSLSRYPESLIIRAMPLEKKKGASRTRNVNCQVFFNRIVDRTLSCIKFVSFVISYKVENNIYLHIVCWHSLKASFILSFRPFQNSSEIALTGHKNSLYGSTLLSSFVCSLFCVPALTIFSFRLFPGSTSNKSFCCFAVFVVGNPKNRRRNVNRIR